MDDAEHLFRTEGPILVYDLVRLNNEGKPAQESVSIVLILMSEPWKLMDPIAASVLGTQNVIRLLPLNNRELIMMLQNIAKSGLRSGTWNQKILESIIRFSAMLGGDMRRARERAHSHLVGSPS
jgi:Cdc6-like AAA superfamily ATPase